jgi:membrane protein implicated in regulation of membrane protease activity
MRKRTFNLFIAAFITITILSLLFAAYASAKTAEELLQAPGLTATQRSAIAEAIAAGNPQQSIPETIKGILEWQEMGDAFAQTIKTICQTLNVEVNAFLRSDVGKLTAAVIIYKMVGKDILRIILYTGVWLGVTFFMMVSILFLHMKKKVKQRVKDPDDKEGKSYLITTKYIERFAWDDDGYMRIGSLIVHIVAWFIFSCIVSYNII